MGLDVWVSIGTLIGTALVLFGALNASIRRLQRDLKADIGRLETELSAVRTGLKGDIDTLRTDVKNDIDTLRTELRTGIGRVDDRITVLDDRVYALAAGLRPHLQRDAPAPRQGTTGTTG